MTCKGEGFALAEEMGIQATKLVEVSYLWITQNGIAWDHASSEVKITVKVNDMEVRPVRQALYCKLVMCYESHKAGGPFYLVKLLC